MQAIAQIINPYQAMYSRLKAAGKIKTVTDAQYTCEKCRDTGYITILDADGNFSKTPCKCLAKIQTEARLQKSGISVADYQRYNFMTFRTDTKEHKDMKNLAIMYLKTRNSGHGIGFFGKPGTGKTHICIAVCQALTRDYGEEHYYFSYRSEIQRIKAVMYNNAEQYSQMIQHWTSVNNLYIDDLFKFAEGRDGKIQQQDMQIMFDIINTRYLNHKATIFSGEKTVNQITRIDEALGSRIKAMLGNYGLKCIDGNARLEKGA